MTSQYGSISIETEKEDYTGGDTIVGKVVMDITEPILCRGVRLEFDGLETTYWTTGSGKNSHTYTETIVRAKFGEVLFGKEPLGTMANMADALKGIFSKDHYETVQPGHYEYDFSFNLGGEIPGDYESGRSSYIRYEIKAYVDIPLGWDFCKTKRLSVYECFTLPEEKSIEAQESKTFMFDAGNPLTVKMKVDNNLYYPGDIVTGSFEVENKSSKEIKAITVGINKVVKMTAHGRNTTGSHVIELEKYETPSIPKYGPGIFNFECKIPEDLYCTLTKSRILKLDYFINVTVDVPWAIDLAVQVPIMLLEEEGFPSGLKKEDDEE